MQAVMTAMGTPVVGLLLALVIALCAVAEPETTLGVAIGGAWTILLVRKIRQVVRRSLGEGWLARLALAGLWIRFLTLWLHLVLGYLVYGGQVDFAVYFRTGSRFGQDILSGNFAFFDLPSQPSDLGWALLDRILALNYILMGPSVVGMFLVSGLIGFLGSYLFVRAYQMMFPAAREQRFVALVLFTFPSLVFWSSLLGKDSWIFLLLGLSAYSLAKILPTPAPQLRDVVALAVSVLVIGAFRPQIGASMVVALLCAFSLRLPAYVRRLRGPAAYLRPVVVMPALFLILGLLAGVVAGLRTFGEGSESLELSDYLVHSAFNKHIGLANESLAGGSSLPVAITEASVLGILQFIPLGMFTALFRPLITEAHNAVAVAASLESTALLAIFLARFPHFVAALRRAPRDPFVLFTLVCFVMFTIAISFEWNFGVLVRHRTMPMPFLFMLLATPRRRSASQEDSRA